MEELLEFLLESNKIVSALLYITVKMYPCSGGTDTGSPEL